MTITSAPKRRRASGDVSEEATWPVSNYLGKTIVVGRDTRRSGDMLGAALSAGIMSAGGTVLEAGIIPTCSARQRTRQA